MCIRDRDEGNAYLVYTSSDATDTAKVFELELSSKKSISEKQVLAEQEDPYQLSLIHIYADQQYRYGKR